MQDLLQTAFNGLFHFLAVVLAVLVVWLVDTAIKAAQEYINHMRHGYIQDLARMLVLAVEQRWSDRPGPEKFKMVQNIAFHQFGVELSDADIEAAVRMMKASGLEVAGQADEGA